MRRSTWKTGAPIRRRGPIGRVTRTALIRQLMALGAIGAVWLIGVVLIVNATDLGLENITVNKPDDVSVSVRPTKVPATAEIVAAVTLIPETPTTSATAKSTSTAASPTATRTTAPTQAPTSTVTQAVATAVASGGGVSFSRDIKPILDRVCVKCHGGEETKEGLVLKSYADLMAGSDNGPVVVPGDTANSLLIELITNGKMPKKGPKLLPGEIRAFTNWVAAGAKNN